MVIVLVPFVNVDPEPEVSQFPETVHEPEVSVIVPLVPPVIVTFVTVTVAWLPLTTPPVSTVRLLAPNVKKPELPAVSVSVPVTSTRPPAVIVPVVMLYVVPLPIVTEPTVIDAVVPVIPPVPTKDTAALPVMLLPLVVRVPDPEVARVLLMSVALLSVIVPEIMSL